MLLWGSKGGVLTVEGRVTTEDEDVGVPAIFLCRSNVKVPYEGGEGARVCGLRGSISYEAMVCFRCCEAGHSLLPIVQ